MEPKTKGAARITVPSPRNRRPKDIQPPLATTLQTIASTVQVPKVPPYHDETPLPPNYVTMTWSPDGHHLAAGLQHGPIVLFAVLPSSVATSTKPLRSTPLRTFRGHTADVLQLKFSSSLLLASASMDRSVRLWHPHASHCLGRIVHPDMVTSVCFHNSLSSVLLSAGCDGVIRAWDLGKSFGKDANGNEDIAGLGIAAGAGAKGCDLGLDDVLVKLDVGSVITSACFVNDNDVCIGTYDGRVLNCPLLSSASNIYTTISSISSNNATSTSSLSAAPLMKLRSAKTVSTPEATTMTTTSVYETRRHRHGPTRRKKPSKAIKVSSIISVRPDTILATTEDGHAMSITNGQVTKRMRLCTGRKDGESIGGASISGDDNQSFLLIDSVGPYVRLGNMRNMNTHVAKVKRGDMNVNIFNVNVLHDDDLVISCASFAPCQAMRRCGVASGGDDVSVEEGRWVVMMAVAASDASLRIVRIDY